MRFPHTLAHGVMTDTYGPDPTVRQGSQRVTAGLRSAARQLSASGYMSEIAGKRLRHNTETFLSLDSSHTTGVYSNTY